MSTSPKVVNVADKEEHFTLLGGFNDIFVVVGIVLLTIGLVALAISLPGATSYLPLVFAAVFWGLGEMFTRRMRLALPSIVLMLLFCVSVFIGLLYMIVGSDTPLMELGMRYGMHSGFVYYVPMISLMTALAACAHYWYFRVPIGLSLVSSLLIMGMVTALFNFFPTFMMAYILPVQGLMGLIPFGAALWLDGKDPARTTRLSDTAFWLHLSAAPMLCRATMAPFVGMYSMAGAGAAVTVLLVFMLWLLMALIINRRVFIVSGISYAAFALGSLLYVFGVQKAGLVSVSGILVGGAVLVLAVWWNPLRSFVLRSLRIETPVVG